MSGVRSACRTVGVNTVLALLYVTSGALSPRGQKGLRPNILALHPEREVRALSIQLLQTGAQQSWSTGSNHNREIKRAGSIIALPAHAISTKNNMVLRVAFAGLNSRQNLLLETSHCDTNFWSSAVATNARA